MVKMYWVVALGVFVILAAWAQAPLSFGMNKKARVVVGEQEGTYNLPTPGKLKPRNEKDEAPPVPSRTPIMPGEEVYLGLHPDPNNPGHLILGDPGKMENDIYNMKKKLEEKSLEEKSNVKPKVKK